MIKHVKKSDLRQIIPEDSDIETCDEAISQLEKALQDDEVMSIVRSSEHGASTEATMEDQLRRFKRRKAQLKNEQNANIN